MNWRRLPVVLLVVLLSIPLLSCDRQLEFPTTVVSADGVPIHFEVHGSGDRRPCRTRRVRLESRRVDNGNLRRGCRGSGGLDWTT